MWYAQLWIIVALSTPCLCVWTCTADAECLALAGAACAAGVCRCRPGQLPVGGGTRCVDVAPYHMSPCVEDHQCSGLFTGYECRKGEGSSAGTCACVSTHHYFLGRCWSTSGHGEACTQHQQCQGLRMPYSMSCDDGGCVCADGYYLRQRGECRRIGSAPGEGCVLDEDCQFENAACDRIDLVCYDTTATTAAVARTHDITSNVTRHHKMAARQNGVECESAEECATPFQCSRYGVCVCPSGYYPSEDGSLCYAELGSPATEENCVGLYKEIQDGVCVCQANFYYEENMRDCVKAVRQFSDSCLSDEQCWTLGAAAYCGPAGAAPWGLRACACRPDQAVVDEGRNMCRLFSAIGEQCQLDSDCLAGGVPAPCLPDDAGVLRCTCPPPLLAVGGLCLTTGLGLGDSCQVSEECTGSDNLACADRTCACAPGYQAHDGVCSPALGGVCSADGDCVVPGSVCSTGDEGSTCRCGDQLLEYDSACWPASSGVNSSCVFDGQCHPLGDGAECSSGSCVCKETHYLVNEQCALMIGLFGACSRSSECFLTGISDRVVCRNGFCQCDYLYPYSEELNTCTSSSTQILASFSSVIIAAIYLIYH